MSLAVFGFCLWFEYGMYPVSFVFCLFLFDSINIYKNTKLLYNQQTNTKYETETKLHPMLTLVKCGCGEMWHIT